MKKILFAAVLAGSFFVAKPASATEEAGSLMPFQDIWDAINDLRNQVTGIQSAQNNTVQESPNDSQGIQPGVMRYVYSVAIPNNISSADYVSENSGEEKGKSYFMKVDTPQISVSDMPMISLYGKEDLSDVHLGGDAWQNKDTFSYIKDGSIYILFAEKKDGQDLVYYLPKGAYKVVVIY
jgi:hypothetical protein